MSDYAEVARAYNQAEHRYKNGTGSSREYVKALVALLFAERDIPASERRDTRRVVALDQLDDAA